MGQLSSSPSLQNKDPGGGVGSASSGWRLVGLGIRGWRRVGLGICKVGGVGSRSNLTPGSCVLQCGPSPVKEHHLFTCVCQGPYLKDHLTVLKKRI